MHRRELEFALSSEPETTFLSHIFEIVRTARSTLRHRPAATETMDVLLAGYLGAGNVGSELRVHELVRQLRWMFRGVDLRFTALSRDESVIANALPGVTLTTPVGYLPDAMVELVAANDAVIACEGSTFKSTFSDSLSAVMGGALALAHDSERVAVAYGAEFAPGTVRLERLIRDTLQDVLLLARNPASQRKAQELGLRSRLGTDTAWTFEPRDTLAALIAAVGRENYLTVCPVNPFWWPVTPNPRLAVRQDKNKIVDPLRYNSVFYHRNDTESAERYRGYIADIAAAVRIIAQDRHLKVVLLAMETLDEGACNDLKQLLPDSNVIVGSRHSLDLIVNILRNSSMMISSRYHALLASTPAGVPSIGIATDERIGGLYNHAQQPVTAATSETLRDDILNLAEGLDPATITERTDETVGAALRLTAKMGREFFEETLAKQPNLRIAATPRYDIDFLPPISQKLTRFL